MPACTIATVIPAFSTVPQKTMPPGQFSDAMDTHINELDDFITKLNAYRTELNTCASSGFGLLDDATIPAGTTFTWSASKIAGKLSNLGNVPSVGDAIKKGQIVADKQGDFYKANVDTTITADDPLAPSGDFTAITDLMDELSSGSVLDADITVNVPTDYATINEAIDFLDRNYSDKFNKNEDARFIAEINLESGFVMDEQVFVFGRDLGWIRISSVDATVTVTRSSMTRTYTHSSVGYSPVFLGVDNAVTPQINVNFQGDASVASANQYGLMLLSDSYGYVGANKGFSSMGSVGLYCEQSKCYANSSVFTSNGGNNIQADLGGIVICKDCTATFAGSRGILALNNSFVYAQNIDVSNSTSRGATSVVGSFIEMRSCIANNCGGDGLEAAVDSVIIGSGATITNCGGDGVQSESGSLIVCDSATITGAGNRGIYAEAGSSVYAVSAVVTGSNSHNVYAYIGSTIKLDNGTATGSTANDGIRAELNSTIFADGVDASGNAVNNVHAFNGSVISVKNPISLANAGSVGISVNASSVFTSNSNITNSSGNGIVVQNNGYIYAAGSDTSGAGARGIYIIDQSRIEAKNIVSNGCASHGVSVYNMSSALINGAGTSVSNNTIGIYCEERSHVSVDSSTITGNTTSNCEVTKMSSLSIENGTLDLNGAADDIVLTYNSNAYASGTGMTTADTNLGSVNREYSNNGNTRDGCYLWTI